MASVSKITVDFTTDLFAICQVQCTAYRCIHHQAGTDYCNLKHIEIDMNHACVQFEDFDEAALREYHRQYSFEEK